MKIFFLTLAAVAHFSIAQTGGKRVDVKIISDECDAVLSILAGIAENKAADEQAAWSRSLIEQISGLNSLRLKFLFFHLKHSISLA